MGADGCGLDGDAGYAGSRTSSVYRAGVKIGGFCRFLGSGAVMIAIYRLPAVPESPFLALVPYRQRVAGPSGDPQPSPTPRIAQSAVYHAQEKRPLGQTTPGSRPFNVAGLSDSARRSWYPVDPDDLLRSASKLQATQDEIFVLLRRCGFQLQ